jgi:hypothetical protein
LVGLINLGNGNWNNDCFAHRRGFGALGAVRNLSFNGAAETPATAKTGMARMKEPDGQGSLFPDDDNDRPDFSNARFNGSDYEPVYDDIRLRGQILRVYDLMKDGEWRSLSEIESLIGDPPASISAQLRHLRKKRFGSHTVSKRARGDRHLGLFEYQLILK